MTSDLRKEPKVLTHRCLVAIVMGVSSLACLASVTSPRTLTKFEREQFVGGDGCAKCQCGTTGWGCEDGNKGPCTSQTIGQYWYFDEQAQQWYPYTYTLCKDTAQDRECNVPGSETQYCNYKNSHNCTGTRSVQCLQVNATTYAWVVQSVDNDGFCYGPKVGDEAPVKVVDDCETTTVPAN